MQEMLEQSAKNMDHLPAALLMGAAIPLGTICYMIDAS